MSWDFNRHHVAKKVLAKHVNELDKKQARISARQDENMRDLQRELISLHSVSTPDLDQGQASPRLPRRTLPNLSKSASQYMNISNGGAPAYSMRSDLRQSASRLYSRRQSEPVAMIGRDLGDIQKLMNKVGCLADQAPDESWNNLLETTLPGSKKTTSRLRQRRGTIAQTEGLNKGTLSLENPALSAAINANGNTNRPRRGSMPINALDPTSVQEESKISSAKSKKDKKGNVSSRTRRMNSRSSKTFKEQNGINVSFYNEDTGEESVPVVPQLQLYDADESSIADDTNDETSLDNADDNECVWKDVAKCRYIRGYDPPEMIAPEEDPATFVFGRTYNDGFQAQQGKTEAK